MTITALVVIYTLLEFFMPDEKLKGMVSMAAGILFVQSIAEPLAEWLLSLR